MQKSDTIALLAAALVKAQPQFKVAKMGSTNPFFKSKYADLGEVWEAVQDALAANGLTVSQFPDAIGQEPALTTCLIHESGEWMEATYPLMVTDKESTPQGYGSALTYARRYGLSAVLGVIADVDDDANQATRPPKPPSSSAPAKPQDSKPAPDAVPQQTQPETPLSDAIAPTITPADWLKKAMDRVKGLDRAGMDEFSEKHHLRIAKCRTVEPVLYEDLMTAIRERHKALG